MKRIICIFITLSVAFSLAACAAKENKAETATASTNAESTSTTVPASKAEEAVSVEVPTKKGEQVTLGSVEGDGKLTLGEITDNGYENKSAGFKIEGLDDSWNETPVNYVVQAFDGGTDPETGKAVYSISEDGSLYYLCDVMYVNKNNESVISVSLLENENGEDLSKIVLEDEGNSLVKGFTNTSELMYINIAGQKAACKKIHYKKTKNFAKIPDVTEYDVFFLSKDKKQAIKVVIVCFGNEVSVEDIAKCFVKI